MATPPLEPQKPQRKFVHMLFNNRLKYWHVYTTGQKNEKKFFVSEYASDAYRVAMDYAELLAFNHGFDITHKPEKVHIDKRFVYVSRDEEKALKYAKNILDTLDLSKTEKRLSQGRISSLYHLQTLINKVEKLCPKKSTAVG